jgi:hypothetical protein
MMPLAANAPTAPCRRDFTACSTSAFSGYRWPQEVILRAMRWYCGLPAVLGQQAADLVDQRRPLFDEPTAQPVNPLAIF